MNSLYLRLNQKINEVVKAPGDQGRIVALAVAFAVSAQSALPSGPVSDLSQFFANQVEQAAIEKISKLGEGVIFATKTSLEFTQTFWKQRYYAAHPDVAMDRNFTLALQSLECEKQREVFDFYGIMAGGLIIMSVETLQFLNKYKLEIATLAQEVLFLIRDDELPAPIDAPVDAVYVG